MTTNRSVHTVIHVLLASLAWSLTLSNSQRWYQLCHYCELSECTSYATKCNLQEIQNTTEHSKHDPGSKCMFVGCTVLLLQFMNVVSFSFSCGLLIFNKVKSEKKLAGGGAIFLHCRYGHFYGPWLIQAAIQFNC